MSGLKNESKVKPSATKTFSPFSTNVNLKPNEPLENFEGVYAYTLIKVVMRSRTLTDKIRDRATTQQTRELQNLQRASGEI